MAEGGHEHAMSSDSADNDDQVGGRVSNLCSPCGRNTKTTLATLLCTSCDEKLCTECSNIHKIYVPGSHVFVKIHNTADVHAATYEKPLVDTEVFVRNNVNQDQNVEMRMPQTYTLKIEKSVHVEKTDGDDDFPGVSGLDFMPDGRLVIVDCYNQKVFVMDEGLRRLGRPYAFTQDKPVDVACYAQDKLVVTLR